MFTSQRTTENFFDSSRFYRQYASRQDADITIGLGSTRGQRAIAAQISETIGQLGGMTAGGWAVAFPDGLAQLNSASGGREALTQQEKVDLLGTGLLGKNKSWKGTPNLVVQEALEYTSPPSWICSRSSGRGDSDNIL